MCDLRTMAVTFSGIAIVFLVDYACSIMCGREGFSPAALLFFFFIFFSLLSCINHPINTVTYSFRWYSVHGIACFPLFIKKYGSTCFVRMFTGTKLHFVLLTKGELLHGLLMAKIVTRYSKTIGIQGVLTANSPSTNGTAIKPTRPGRR